MGHVFAHAVHQGKRRSGVKLIWVAPLRALSADIADAARAMAKGLGLDWVVGTRTGDTSAKEKAKQRTALPDVLITTPESLHILIAQKGGAQRLAAAAMVVVDEWHELLGSKRGVQVELAVSWIRHCAMQRGERVPVWGVSATLAQPQEALEALVGHRDGTLVRADITKEVHITSTMPKAFARLPWAGHIGLQLLDEVTAVVEAHRSTLIFTNTRRQAEVWYQALLDHKPEWAGLLAMHHGSISRELRTWVEDALHDGRVRAVVCTASLDLGVDFRPVDAVVQIGGPKGVSRMIQRAGRCGHRPGESSTAHFVPTHGLELLEAVALREAIAHGEIEPKNPLMLCWDVLVQWLCTLAVGDGFEPDEVVKVLRGTFAFREMEPEDWQQCLDLISTGGPSLRAYTEHRRVDVDEEGRWVMRNRTKARRHRMSMGAIVSATMVSVQLKGQGLLGHVEETFVASLKEGDSFVFAGHTVALVSFQGLVAKVRRSKSSTARTPAWMGGRMSLSSELSHRLRWAWDRMAGDQHDWEPELQRLSPMVQIQAERSHIPRAHQLLVETFQDDDGHHLFMYPFEGRKVHEALAMLLAYRLSLMSPQTFNWACNDDGLELLSDQPIDWAQIVDANLLDPSHLMDDLSAGFNASELVRRKFRDVATIAGLVFQGFPGAVVKERHLLTSTNLLLQVFQDHDPDNLLLRQAQDEMLADQLEFGRLLLWLQSMPSREVVHCTLDKPSPLAFPLFVDRLRERLSSETLESRLKRMAWA
jgi:ATP-dependent Lhr-like helicase